MTLPETFIFSQSSLQDYVECPRRFELKYLLRQRYPAPEVDHQLDFERRMGQGEHLHHLIHQHLVGIPTAALLKRLTDDDVRRWFEAYLKNGLADLPTERRPEVTLMMPLGDFALLAKFDLLAVARGKRAVIVDWKTGQKIPRPDVLAKRLQTIVYRYVLARGGDHLNGGQPIPPDQITMVYWYAEYDGATRELAYDAAQLAADEAYLLGIVDEINTRQNFPLTDNVGRCRFCVYRSLCNRGSTAGGLAEWEGDAETDDELTSFTLDLDQITEIAF